ncbi:MAG TPA: ROK family protein [Puia sp.]|jgi:glucokinase|nr:ROK family protein [Puia sp.]
MTVGKVIGVDLGATNIRGAVVSGESLSAIVAVRIHSDGLVEDVLGDIYHVIDALMEKGVEAIGIGVPSVVDVTKGIVYDVQYIPSWVEVPLKRILESRYGKPVFVNNDANCFALGELYFGKGKGVGSMIGLTLGTGLGGGVIINKKLYAGYNCGAGEIGLLPYGGRVLEYYCSGSFFRNVYGLDGVEVYEAALAGDVRSLELYAELGVHVGQAIKAVIYTYDPELCVLGGSVSQAYDLFSEAMWKEIRTLVYAKTLERMRIEVSNLKNSGILGAAALYYDAR